MTILSGTKLVALSAPAGQRPWTIADKLVRDSKALSITVPDVILTPTSDLQATYMDVGSYEHKDV